MDPYFDPDYDRLLNQSIAPPRACVDNNASKEYTLIKVDSLNEPGILLEVVQVLSDLDLTISKAYITSDGKWFMDAFHVTDRQGRKLSDPKIIEHIEHKAWNKMEGETSRPPVGMHPVVGGGDRTAIELVGADRPGLLSEVFAVLASLHCNVVAAEVWTHRTRVACIVYIDNNINDTDTVSLMRDQLNNVMRSSSSRDKGRASFTAGAAHVDRRLHQLMQLAGDGDKGRDEIAAAALSKPTISLSQCGEKAYSVVNIKCKDRPKLLFDIVCTLTDLHYSVFHASVTSDSLYALQELYIRRKDGRTLESSEEERVINCLEAAIMRRVSEGLTLELCCKDRVGLLSDMTRVLREYGLSVARAEVTTVGGQAMSVFYVTDASDGPLELKTIEALRFAEMDEAAMLKVIRRVPFGQEDVAVANKEATRAAVWAKAGLISFGSLLARFLSS